MIQEFPARLRVPAIIFIIYCAIFSYSHLLGVDLMEARNFVAAREMVEYNNWLLPTMNGELRITKPPLPTWLTALAMKFAGSDANLLVNRLPTGLAALLLLFFFYKFALIYTECPETSKSSTLILATSYMFMFMSRRGNWDMMSQTFMMGTIFTLYKATKQEKGQIAYLAASGICAGLSVMCKGPVAMYGLLLPFLLSEFLNGEKKRYCQLWRIIGISVLITFLISAAWPTFIYYSHPKEFSEVGVTEITSWSNRHVKPLYWYLQFPAMTGVWMLFLLPALWMPHSSRINGERFPTAKVVAWIFISLILLSLIPEKKDRYLLPLTIPMALLIGAYINGLTKSAHESVRSFIARHIFRFYGWLFTILSSAGIVAGFYCMVKYGFDFYLLLITVATATMVLSLSSMLCKQRTPDIIHYLLAFSLLTQTSAHLSNLLRKEDDYMELLRLRQHKQLATKDFYSFYPGMKEVWAVGNRIHTWQPGAVKNLKDIERVILINRPGLKSELPGLDVNKYQIVPVEATFKHWQLYQIQKITLHQPAKKH